MLRTRNNLIVEILLTPCCMKRKDLRIGENCMAFHLTPDNPWFVTRRHILPACCICILCKYLESSIFVINHYIPNIKQQEDYKFSIILNNWNICKSTIENNTLNSSKKGNTCSRCQKSGHTTTQSKNWLFCNEWLIRWKK